MAFPNAPLPEPLCQLTATSPELARLLQEVDARNAARSRQMGPEALRRLEALRLELTYHSNGLEGNTLTLRETQLVIEGRSPGEKDLREIYEARNHHRALAQVEAWSAEPAAHPLITESHLLEIHRLIMTDILPQSAGSYRHERVRIAGAGYIPPGAHRFPGLILPMLDRANSGIATPLPPMPPPPPLHPIILATELHYNVVAIHPFSDGNGRTARLMMNFLLLRHGLPLTVITKEQRREYLEALDRANQGDLLPLALLVAARSLVSLEEF